uniref:Uncharacterized protein n=1 Tax=Panagrolaimus sp. PS1159 TaxID=55785 RepID=A0AC35GMY0_9BILA
MLSFFGALKKLTGLHFFIKATDFDTDDSYQPRAYRDMTINTASEITSYLDTTSEEMPQNHRRKTNSTNPNNIDNSILSLHIAEYENSSSRSVNPKTSGLSFGPPLRNAKTDLDLSFVNVILK